MLCFARKEKEGRKKTGKVEIINLLESVSPTRLTIKEIVNRTKVNKQTVSRCLKKMKEPEKNMYGIKSIRCRRETTVKGKVYVSIEKRWWIE